MTSREKKREKNRRDYPRTVGQLHTCRGSTRREEEKRTEAIPEAIMTDNFSQNNVRHQTTNPRSENTRQNKCPPKTTQRDIIFKLQKIKNKEKILKEGRGKRHLT